MNVKMWLIAVVAVAASALLAGCGSGGGDGSSGSTGIRVVASTNVWGDIVRQVGGDRVEITSILNSPDQDPHSFEANVKTALAVSKADLVIENGGGYDDYMDQLLKASTSHPTVLNAVDISGKKAVGGELNEHVWYDFPTVEKVADSIAAELGKVDPDHAAEFSKRAGAFKADLGKLIAREDAVKSTASGLPIAITEPVPLYMTEAAGLVNKTPAKFSEGIEEGEDVSARVLDQTLSLYRSHEVKALFYNEQTSGPLTEKVKAAAANAGIAVVPVTETLPRGDDYLEWMTKNLDALTAAVTHR